MATWNTRPITPAYWNESNRYLTYPVATGEDFGKGAPVILNTDGEIEEAGADPSLVLGFATCAASEATPADTFGYADARLPVALADQVFRGTLEGTLDIDADISDQFGLVDDATSGYWTIDRSDTSNVVVTVIGYEDGVADGDVNPPVLFKVIDTVRQADS